MGNLPPELYWRQICEQIDNGMFAEFGLGDLVSEVSRRFPQNAELGDLANADLVVLCLMAAPGPLNRLRLGAEHRVIRDIAGRRGPRRMTVGANLAAQPDDIIGEILASKPDIIHFSGHGSADGRLIFEDASGASAPVTVGGLEAILRAVSRDLACVVLGSCYSGDYAEMLLSTAQFVAGSVMPLADAAAIEFTRGFYTALAVGGSGVPDAFDAGLAQMRLHSHATDGLRLAARDQEPTP